MGIFGKKKASQEDASQAAGNVVTQPKKGKKKKDGMGSILSESVMETVLAEMKGNKPCIAERDGSPVYVGLLLDVADIGGLSKKSRKDEAKGSIIECMNSGRIKTLITPELMEAERLIIVPDILTVDAVDEFGLLTEAPYKLAFVTDDGMVEQTDIPATYQEFAELVSNDGDVMDLLADKGVDWVFEPDDESAVEDEVELDEPVASDGTEIMDALPDDDSFDVFDDEAFMDDEPPVDETPVDEEPAAPAHMAEPEEGESVEPEEEEPVEEEVDYGEEVPDALVEEAITRVFHSDDLGLSVSTDAFDAQFVHDNAYIPFNEDRGEGWLAEYVSNMAKDANTEMQRIHRENIMAARKSYYELLSGYCEQIQKDLDDEDPETKYGQLKQGLDDSRRAALQDVERRVSVRKAEMQGDWEKELEKVGQEAAARAQQQHRERFGKLQDEKIYRIEPTVRAQIEDDYRDHLRDLQAQRRAEASKRLDYAETETLVEVGEVYQRNLAAEAEQYRIWREAINSFIDDNRKEDIAHDKMLAEELAQTNKAEQVMAEYREKFAAQTQEFEAKAASLKAELDAAERKMREEYDLKATRLDERYADMVSQRDSVQAKLDDLLGKYAALDSRKDEEYRARLLEVQGEKDSWMEKFEHVSQVHRRSNYISVALTIVAVVAALAIGCIFGMHANLDFSSSAANQAIEQEFNERLDNLEAEHGTKQAETPAAHAADATTAPATETSGN